MRLQKIHLGGFKSFAEPTTIELTEQMVGIVGPNGCGKSNVVDAIRWVMGETPRHIRASSFDEVIFSGTSNRKPMEQAFVELVFNDPEDSLRGRYAEYSELNLRRAVDRNRETKYYINNKRCLRRDITDIFLGTGLGVNSYAIIEQGTISRVIEAKPHEMWRYIEEAAGISRYKERRRETETRIKHTRENLDRVMDLREEIDRQLQRLKKQSSQANRYKALCLTRDTLQADLKWLEIRGYEKESASSETTLSEKKIEMTEKQKALCLLEETLEQQRKRSSEVIGAERATQEKVFRLDVQINNLDEELRRYELSAKADQAEQQDIERQLQNTQAELEAEQQKIIELDTRAVTAKTGQQQLLARGQALRESIPVLEQEIDSLRKLRDKHQSASQESSETAKVEKARGEFFHKALNEIEQTLAEIKKQRETMDLVAITAERKEKNVQLIQHETQEAELQQRMEQATEQIQSLRKEARQLGEELNVKQEQGQSIQGQIASLEVLNQAQLGHDKESFHQWLKTAGLSSNSMVSEKLDVATGWENAVETVLGAFLEGVRVDALSDKADFVSDFSKGTLVMVEATGGVAKAATLGEKISASSGLQEFLSHVYLADNLEAALRRREQLGQGESVITKDGVWVGKNWLQMRCFEEDQEGVLIRKKRIEKLQQQYQDLLRDTVTLKQKVATTTDKLTQCETLRDQTQDEHSKLLSEIAALKAEASRCEEKIHQISVQTENLDKSEQEAVQRRQKLLEERDQSLQEYDRAEAQIQEVTEQFGNVENAIAEKEKDRALKKNDIEALQTEIHQTELEQESIRGACGIGEKHMEQLKSQGTALRQQAAKLTQRMSDHVVPMQEKKSQREALLGEKQQVEAQRAGIDEQQKREQEKLDALLGQRKQFNEKIEQIRSVCDDFNANLRVSQARYEDSLTAFKAMEVNEDEIVTRLSEGADIKDIDAQLKQVLAKIERLGAINLVALEEFREHEERKQKIDDQCTDLTTALVTLESAIKKIDHETNTRFNDTFERINQNLKEVFPMLFMGGEAYLRMTDYEGEAQGITVMVKPPGKRLSSIQLMSGGEKALAAAAVIFSIFKLNPAPFCVLDEVDAPLDEHNVTVFCDMLRSMHEQVQFIMVTHNKVSMEYMDALIGITMHESGVSRLVSVNVDKAMKFNSA